MAGEWVFISHSAKDRLSRAFLDHLRQRLGDSFHPLVDYERLEGGAVLTDRLREWAFRCDAAVVVVSEAALDSPWVITECAWLNVRAAELHVIPVVVKEGDADALADHADAFRTSGLAISGVDRALWIGLRSEAGVAQTVEDVIEQLRRAFLRMGTDLRDPSRAFVLATLRRHERDQLRLAFDALRCSADPGQEAAVVTRALLEGFDPPRLVAALVAARLKRQDALTLLRETEALWVNPEAAVRLRALADTGRVQPRQAGVNAEPRENEYEYSVGMRAAEHYLRRASLTMRWEAVWVAAVGTVVVVTSEVRVGLCRHLCLQPNQQASRIRQELAQHRADYPETPVVLCFHGEPPPDALRAVHADFPDLPCLVIVREDVTAEVAKTTFGLDLLQPILPPAHASSCVSRVESARKRLIQNLEVL